MSEATLLDRSWKEDFSANEQAAGHEAHMRTMAAENAACRWAIYEIDRLRNEIEASDWNDPRP